MYTKPINNHVKKLFDEIYKSSTQKADIDYQNNIEIKIKNLGLFEKLVLLENEKKRINKLINESQYLFYIRNHSSDEWLLSQFASRTFLLNIDESYELGEAIYLGHYRSKISDLKHKLTEEVPKYSYQKFITGTECHYFHNIPGIQNIAEEDFYRIKDWQAEIIQRVISFEYLYSVKKIQQYCKTLKKPLHFILNEKKIIEDELEIETNNSITIKTILSKLFIFKNINLERLNDSLIEENFKSYMNSEINFKRITPNNFNSIISKIEKNLNPVFENEFTIFFTLNKISNWYDSILKGQPIQENITEPDWNKIIETTKEEASEVYNAKFDEIDDYVNKIHLGKKEKKIYLFEKLEEYRHKFNTLDEHYYFGALKDDKEELLKRAFITNSFFCNDYKKQSEILKESLIIYNVLWYVVQTHSAIFKTHKMGITDKFDSSYEVIVLLNQMVVDNELYNELDKITNDFIDQFHSYFIPMEIHLLNSAERLNKIFNQALERLEGYLNDSEQSVKLIYLQSRIKELRQRELKLSQFKDHEHFSKKDYKYSKLFKEFLLIEADFIKETNTMVNYNPLNGNKAKLSLPPANNTLEKIISDNKLNFILRLLEDLGITTDNTSTLSQRRKGAIRGIVIALRDANILPNQSIEILVNLLAAKIGLEINSKLDSSTISDTFEKKAKQYIKQHYSI